MKRLLCTMLVISLLIISLCIPVAAELYTRNFTNNFIDSFVTTVSDSNGLVSFYFEPIGMNAMPEATVNMAAPSGTVGRVLSMIACNYAGSDLDPEAWTASSEERVNNAITCTAYLRIQPFATKVNFYAARSRNGVTNAWDYYYTASNHLACGVEEELMTIKADFAKK